MPSPPCAGWNEELWGHLKGLSRTASALRDCQGTRGLTPWEQRQLTDTEAALRIVEEMFYAPLVALLEGART